MTRKPSYEFLVEENKRLFDELKRKKVKLTQLVRELEGKNFELAQSHKDISDSINYARRIQRAIMPPEYYIKKLLPESFFFYRPRDVVSGDFYYVEEAGDEIILAAVDATGHGVPGALLSVVGFNFINQAVTEKGLIKPADILNYLDTGVNDLLRQTAGESGVYDGMDISLCTLNPRTRVLQYAGAYNPLYIAARREPPVPKTLTSVHSAEKNDYLLWEVHADKFPIGMNLDGVSDIYTNHSFQLQPGETFYLFSDGYPDQFGGPEGRKFMYPRFRKMFLGLQDQSMDEQRITLEKHMDDWQGKLDQVDDILVVGVKV